MRLLIPAIATLLAAAMPATGQDFFRSFERLVEDVQPTPAEQRPEVEEAEPAEDEGDEPPLPRPRPEALDAIETPLPRGAGPAEEAAADGAGDAEPVIPTPDAPERIYRTACPALISGVVVGEMLDPIAEGICGERSPLSVTGVRVNGRGIGFSSPVTTNCQMAGAVADWLGEIDAYAKAALDSPIATLNTGTSMMCRNRYSAEDGFVSEHGFANAVDVTGFTLEDGRSIGVEADWLPAAAAEGRLLRQAHGAACWRFTTVLGPEANAEHEDHFHLDLGCHGQSCVAQICE